MERIVFFGKGGIGKSTTASNISATLAAEGRRVLHVGCDPKHDSTVALLRGTMIEPVVDRIHSLAGLTADRVVTRSHLGVDCVEAGGPEAGRGCGGRAVSRAFEIFEEVALVDSRYQAVVYDVLGDVVCGGFAAPMRRSAGSKVCIVLSEELMAAYAANRISAAVREFADNGVVLAGLVVNLRNNRADLTPIRRLADRIEARVLGVLPRDPLVCEAEMHRKTIVGYAPDSPVAVGVRQIVERVLALDRATCTPPKPLLETHVRTIMRGFEVDEVELPPLRENPVSTVTEWSRLD